MMDASPPLPADLIFNILSRLPVKSLCKFKSVSRLWHSIITDPYFISTHKIRSSQNPNLLLLRRKTTGSIELEKTLVRKTLIEVISLDFDGNQNSKFEINLNESIELLPSKWDLICFVGENGFYACNPSTQELVMLPEPSWCTSGDLNAGIGYVKERNEYVLIHLFDRSMDFTGDNDMGCEIMRLRDGCRVGDDCSWKVTNANCPYMVRGWGVLVENVFYWMIWDVYDHPGDEAILSFGLENEEFGTISPPAGCFDPNGVWLLVELTGLLCLVDIESRPLIMDIWVLNDCMNHEWVKRYSISLNSFSEALLKFITPIDQRDGEILMDLKQESLDCYNLENKSFKRMDNFVNGEWTWLRIYTESFFSFGTLQK